MRTWGGVVLVLLAACGGEPAKQKREVDRNCLDGYRCVAGLCEPTGVGGGGGAADCPSGCEAWQTCQPGNGGTCRDLTVTIDSPQDGAEFGAGAQVRVVARVTEWDGGAWQGASIPASATGGATAPGSLMRNGSSFEGDFGLPMTAGMPTLTAGWPATNDSVAVAVKACGVACQPWQECRPSADGGSCADLGLQVAWTRPTDGEGPGPGASASVPLELSVTRADGGAFGGTVPFVLVGRTTGVLMPSGGNWVGSVDAGPQDGMRTVIAGWDAGPAPAMRSFAIVATPPTVELFPQAAPMRPADDTDGDGQPRWKKYESAPIQVESNRPLAAIAPAQFANAGVTTSTRCTRMCGAGKFCQCFEVDLAQQTLATAPGELAGTVTVTLNTATDVYGNTASAIAPVQAQVTRFKWKRAISSGTATTPVALAILDGGVVVAGVTTTPTAGANASLTAFRPDGGVSWTNSYSTEAITAGPLVGTRGLYFGVYAPGTTPIASIRRLDMAGTSPAPLCLNTQSFTGDLALVNPGSGEAVVAMRSDSFLVPTATGCVPGAFPASPSPGTPSSANRPTLVVSGTDAFVGMGQRAPIWKFTAANSAPVAAGSISTSTLFPSNLFVVGADIVGGGSTVGGAFVFRNTSVLSGTTTNATPGTDLGGAAVVGGTTASPVVHYGDTSGAERRVLLDPQGPIFGAADAGQFGSASFADRSPLVGSSGRLYVVGSDGTLRVLNSTTLVEEWRWDNAFPSTAISQLNLDINRDVAQPCAAGQPGVLYVAASSGAATWLYAVLVDSPGLDRNAPWPRHQHDPANTGNPATPLTPWTCP